MTHQTTLKIFIIMATLLNTFNNVTIYRSERLDCYGNPRCIVHFLDFLTDSESYDRNLGISESYEIAHKRAKKVGFRKYTSREFGGGFICQYDYCGGREIAERVIKSREL